MRVSIFYSIVMLLFVRSRGITLLAQNNMAMGKLEEGYENFFFLTVDVGSSSRATPYVMLVPRRGRERLLSL